ncbi:MAG: hypothetical protein OEY09_12220 [Gammaproteobacteria bacterium]|nr:hypothetical protein [Gammaproteobacteria bacterium]
MNTQLKLNASTETRLNVINKLIISLFLMASSSVYATDSYQQNVLFSPSDSILQSEAKGRIMIYDGLKNETIELALNEQFDRIDNMMFVNIEYEQEDGEYEAEDDDDC